MTPHTAKPPRWGWGPLVGQLMLRSSEALEDAGVEFIERTKTKGPGVCLKG